MAKSFIQAGYQQQSAATSLARVLVVDDELTNLRLMGDLLSPYYEVLIARSVAEARDVLQKQIPDLLLLDVMMPEVDGFSFCRELKENNDTRNLPVIFVTALHDETDELKGLQLGAVDFIHKPISAPILLARVHTHLELKRRTDMLEQRTLIDALTGVGNRRAYDLILEAEWRRLQRKQSCLSMLIVDIDQFKLYNDCFGHRQGDECLQKIALVLSNVISRSSDQLTRYGGEEFALLLPETPLKGAVAIGERAMQAIRDLNLPHAPDTYHSRVTVSIGVACLYPSDKASPETLFLNADEQLYEAKNAGRDRICFHPE
ncbi:diguanylate cyclase [Amphritea sp. 1_MG-2023]|uniref:diguanylate cyclase n=1 Tax=Amphritea sp. 1_MG-2023 TaxID=3062670 RepID=UPI0026E195CB|nr:diguanylate cyclase [Amphritea sp. 1_MG-2023]MDO6562306.1 diguanylate cyclase [Amphritea sp. 1_MG-2023]